MSRLFRKLYTALCAASAVFPLTALLGYYLLPAQNRPEWFLSLLCAGVLGAFTCVIPGKARIPWTVLCLAGLSFLFSWPLLPGMALVLFAMLWATPRLPGFEFPQPVWTSALFFSIFCVVVAFFARKGLQEGAEFFSGALRGNFALYTGLFLLHLNRDNVLDSVSRQSGQAPPRSIRIRNRLLSLGFAAVLYLASSWNLLKSALSSLAGGIRWLLNTLFSWFQLPESQEHFEEVYDTSQSGMGGLPPGEAAPFWIYLEYIAKIIAAVALAAIAGYLCYLFGKKLARFIRLMIEKMRSTADALSENYQDLAESIFDWEEIKHSASERLKNLRRSRASRIRWEDLDSRQKVRYAYAALLSSHPEVSESVTARQALTREALLSPGEDGAALADIYDAARYSELNITSAQAQAMGKAARLGG